MKKTIISILWPGDQIDKSCRSDVIEIAPDAIESFKKNLNENLSEYPYICRTISGQVFYVTQEVHDALIEAE